ncbi:hypothetical protein ACVWW6_006395 [Bradyrhizobium sp. USDA 3311]
MAPIYQLGARAKSGATFCAATGPSASCRERGAAVRSRGRSCPSLASVRRPMEAKGRREGRAPAAHARPCAIEVHTVWTTGDAGRPAFPARMVLTVSFVLSPGSDALLPPSPCRSLIRAPGRAATSPQDLTHRPRASGPHDFSVRGRPRLVMRVIPGRPGRASLESTAERVARWIPGLPAARASRNDGAGGGFMARAGEGAKLRKPISRLAPTSAPEAPARRS